MCAVCLKSLEQVAHFFKAAVIGRRGHTQQVAQQRIDANVAETVCLHIAHLEIGTDGTETHLHVGCRVVKAVTAALLFGRLVGKEPAHIGQDHHITHVLIGAVTQIGGYVGTFPRTDVVHTLQGIADGVYILRRTGINQRGIIVAETLIPTLGQHVVDVHKALGIDAHSLLNSRSMFSTARRVLRCMGP